MHSQKTSQIQQTHAPLIHQVVQACHDENARQELDPMLQQALSHGWENLVVTIRRILNGERDEKLLMGLDEEDCIIVRTILDGLQNPNSLPDPQTSSDPSIAAPGLAMLIRQTHSGDKEAANTLRDMAEHMHTIPGDMSLLASSLEKLIDGERDLQILSQGMSGRGQRLLQEILSELGKLTRH